MPTTELPYQRVDVQKLDDRTAQAKESAEAASQSFEDLQLVSQRFADELGVSVESVAKPAGVDPKWITECAKDLKAAGKED